MDTTFKKMSFFLDLKHVTPVAKLVGIRFAMASGQSNEAVLKPIELMEFCGCSEPQLWQALRELRDNLILDYGHRHLETRDEKTAVVLELLPPMDVADEEFSDEDEDGVVRVDPRRTRILAKTGGKCFYCHSVDAAHLDHMQPASRGGSDADDNMIGACASCNIQKKDRTVEEYRAWLAHRLKSDISKIKFLGEAA